MDKFTKEQQVQAVYDLKVGYTLGHADIAMLKSMARQLLASMEQEPMAWVTMQKEFCDDERTAITNRVDADRYSISCYDLTPLYAAPQLPQLVVAITQHFDTIALDTAKMVMCDVNRRDEFLGGDIQLLSRIQCRIDEACLAAMLQAGNSPVIQDGWIKCSERMPEDEQEVLTRNRMGHCFVSFFDEHSGLFFDRVDVAAACCIEHILVTHWMPLPAAPQQEE
ncbi:DUF551 domain-containing protein [Citrobacter sp. R-1.5.2]|uniref:DUF551 domain-containing protein n=1 Tax=Citrobacter sp. R-1.5.2 TaxID=3046183 RepID=UPI002B240115|nr:DUF551 domain-containing protein [Citrobacter sp. R-1.5.2]MEB2418257.1 DUF551 domain-containing protein [Citrobacter sp. R-1.5.2]